MKKRNWRIGSLIVILFLVLTGWKMNVAAAGTVTIFIDQKTLNVDDTLRVTVQTSEPEDDAIPPEVTLNYDNSLLEFTYCSEEYGGGEGGLITLSSTTANLSFVAKKAGTASLSAEAVIDGDGNNKATANRSVSISGTNSTTTEQKDNTNDATSDESSETAEKEESTEQEEDSEESEPKELSSNADLKKFKVYEAKLSPKFSSDVTEYTVTMKGDTKQLLFTAKTKDSKAKVLAASGFSNLKNGNNRAVLNVEAEDGTKKTYTFTIVKEGVAASTEDTSQREVAEEVNGYIAIEDGELYVNTTFPEEMVPEGFKKINYVYKEQIIEAAYSEMGEMILLYLSNMDGSMGDFYIYYSGTDEFMDFIQIKGGEGHFIFPIQFPVGIVIPDGFQDSALQWNDKTVRAFMVAMKVDDSEEETDGSDEDGSGKNQEAETPEADELTEELEMAQQYAQPEDFYLVYAMNQNGEEGFYLYDSLEGTYQRYLDMSYIALDNDTFDRESYVTYKKKSQNRMIVIGFLIVIVVVMSFLIFNMFLKIRELEQCLDDEEEENTENKVENKVKVENTPKKQEKDKGVKRISKNEKAPKNPKESEDVKKEKKQKVKEDKKSLVKSKEKTKENSKEPAEVKISQVVEKEPEMPAQKPEAKRPGPVMFDLTTPKVDGSLSPKTQREQLDDDFEFEFINIDE